MKTWKMLGCLVLLCAIICSCAALAAKAQGVAEGDADHALSNMEQALQNESGAGSAAAIGGSVAVTPTYSEGLRFRSNGDGTCALAGLGSCTATCVLVSPKSPAGDVVTEILPYALEGAIIGAIEIPATVRSLSAASFAGCQRLCLVRVAGGSEFYSEYDGVLYSADGTMLVYCPAGRTSGVLKLHPALSRIAAGAFAECKGLESVVFSGSTAAWHSVIVGDDNDGLYAAGLRFSGS